MFTGATAEIRGTSLRKRGGFRGLSCGFDGLADGPLGIPGVTAYTLRSGNVVYLPSDWDSMSSIQKLLWIESSDLPANIAIELEDEAGVSTPTVAGYDPFKNLPNAQPGPSAARPGYDYVRAGDVVRVTLPLQTGIYLDSGAVLAAIAGTIQNSNLTYIGGNAPGLFGGGFTIDVQPRNDFSHLSDIAAIVQTAARANNFNPTSPATASFVSKVESTAGQVQIAQMPGVGPSSGEWWKDLTKNLGGSSNLLLLGGAGVLLLVVLAKK